VLFGNQGTIPERRLIVRSAPTLSVAENQLYSCSVNKRRSKTSSEISLGMWAERESWTIRERPAARSTMRGRRLRNDGGNEVARVAWFTRRSESAEEKRRDAEPGGSERQARNVTAGLGHGAQRPYRF
jgi:hypothetical protein